MSKYLVYKSEDMERWLYAPGGPSFQGEAIPKPIEDAVVIRRQDAFAPPALDAYANAITLTIELLEKSGVKGINHGLQDIADFFHEQAQLSWDTNRKLPD